MRENIAYIASRSLKLLIYITSPTFCC